MTTINSWPSSAFTFVITGVHQQWVGIILLVLLWKCIVVNGLNLQDGNIPPIATYNLSHLRFAISSKAGLCPLPGVLVMCLATSFFTIWVRSQSHTVCSAALHCVLPHNMLKCAGLHCPRSSIWDCLLAHLMLLSDCCWALASLLSLVLNLALVRSKT